jgi:error-prone DNA polymerase
VGWHNPPIPWTEYERLLRDASRPGSSPPVGADAGDSPAWSAKRAPYQPSQRSDESHNTEPLVPYAELHVHSSFSFLDGVSSPEDLVAAASQKRLHAIALTDHDGFYGVVRFAEAAQAHKMFTVFGSELSLTAGVSRTQHPDPPGPHLLLLARGPDGYHRMASALTTGHLEAGEKGVVTYDEDALADQLRDHVVVLTGCRKGAVRHALQGPRTPSPSQVAEAERELIRLINRYGSDNVIVELYDHQHPLDSVHNDIMNTLATRHSLKTVATGLVHYATLAEAPLAHMMAAVRSRRSLDQMRPYLPPAPTAFIRSGYDQATRFARFPTAVSNTVTVADELAFPLKKVTPNLPLSMVPSGHTSMSYLRMLIADAIPRRYPNAKKEVVERIERELTLIEGKGFAGYFLIVHDIVQWARARGILCQGRGSAANSAVCFLLDITAVDSVYYNLPFERFLSTLRDEEPDIDVDFEANRREEVIQYVYQRYGRTNAAQVATVIEYRAKNAVRDVARALGYSPGQQDAFSKNIERRGALTESDATALPAQVVSLAKRILTLPRHLGIHSGGMVLTDRPIGEVVPIEHARKTDRTVLQWDKDDCEWMGLVKFDLLGLGILEAIQHTLTTARDVLGEDWELATLPRDEPAVYDMLCRADSIGVFQVESRAQMALLPRLQPRKFYHLAIQIAMIRPGPIQGGAVHPFVRRKAGVEPVEYLHPALESCLERTLGVPVFQEQIMQIAMAVGGCTGEDADLLRRAMGSKRGLERIEKLRETLYRGMADSGIDQATADRIYRMIQAFASFGFAESHSLSFALLVYASSWLKLHYPAIYLMGLLRAWPMGFYSPATLVSDAERHGVSVLTPSVQHSDVLACVESLSPDTPLTPTGLADCLHYVQPDTGDFDPDSPDISAHHRRDGQLAVRLGLASIDGIGRDTAARIVSDRQTGGPFAGIYDLTRRVGLGAAQVEALSVAGALEGLGLGRREAVWLAGPAATANPQFLAGTHQDITPPLFPEMSDEEVMRANRITTGMSPGDHPMTYLREWVSDQGVLSTDDLRRVEPGRRVWVAGVITHRQRPATAKGVTFLNLEDEHGLVNVICSVGVWKKYRLILRHRPAAVIRGILERSPEGVISLVADGVSELALSTPVVARDFQ